MFSFTLKAQEKTSSTPVKKEVRMNERLSDFRTIDSLLHIKSYQVETYKLQNKTNGVIEYISINPDENYLWIDSDNITMERKGMWHVARSFDSQDGYETKGLISDYKVEKDEKSLSFTVRFRVDVLGRYHYRVVLYIDSNSHTEVEVRYAGTSQFMTGTFVGVNKAEEKLSQNLPQ